MSPPTHLAAVRTLVLAAALVIVGGSGIAAMTRWTPAPSELAPSSSEAEAEAEVAAVPAAGGARASERGSGRGVVTSTRKLATTLGASAGYEITVRMMDGTSHAFIATLPSAWRPGQRLIVIDGAPPVATTRG